MTSLSITIMAAAPRRAQATTLCNVLLGQLEAAWDAGHDVARPVISMDEKMEGARLGASRAWATAGLRPHANHLVIQDDVVVCSDFVRAACDVLAARPSAPVSFFFPDVLCASVLPAPLFFKPGFFLGTQAVAMPRAMALQAAAFLERDESRLDDTALDRFFREPSQRVYVTHPGLVDHDHTVDSLLGHTPLRSRRFIGAERCGSDYDWATARTYEGAV